MLQPFYQPAANQAIIIPVHETVSGTESVALPFPLLAPLVELASARFVVDACLCRSAEGCRNYPADIGCLFLGDGAARIAAVGDGGDHEVGAADHVAAGVELGVCGLAR